MKTRAAETLLILCALLLVGWLLKVQAEQLALLEVEVDGLRASADPWRGRMPS